MIKMRKMMDKFKQIQERHDEYEKILAEMRIAYAGKNHKPIELLTNKTHKDRGWLIDKVTELETQLERKCIWTRVNNSHHCWDKYDAWSTSCGEDFAIEEEWDDKVPNFCNNCGGKAIEAILENDDG